MTEKSDLEARCFRADWYCHNHHELLEAGESRQQAAGGLSSPTCHLVGSQTADQSHLISHPNDLVPEEVLRATSPGRACGAASQVWVAEGER